MENMAASWDHERSEAQLFTLVAFFFQNKTIFIRFSNMHNILKVIVIVQL